MLQKHIKELTGNPIEKCKGNYTLKVILSTY